MKNIAAFLIVLAAICTDLNAQSPATFHVFPQIADGFQPDSSAYYSTVVAINTGTTVANCTIRAYGAAASHFTGSMTLPVPPSGGIAAKNSALTDGVFAPLATGYATLSCDRPVFASVAYFNLAPGLPNFKLLAGATVFSSPPTTRAEVVVATAVGFRTAVAIANDTDSAAQYQITVTNDSGQTIATTNVSVPARSNVAKFIDELIQLPAGLSSGGAIISSTLTPFSVVGLLFNGATFLSMGAATFE
jgi:hypothetical protein